ncbi:hypothetical protein BDE02_02G041900 [Populus trichocarpa]|nr:hypothetical protein BDE02_02G041900 [Populus trichocarpa]
MHWKGHSYPPRSRANFSSKNKRRWQIGVQISKQQKPKISFMATLFVTNPSCTLYSFLSIKQKQLMRVKQERRGVGKQDNT